MNILLYTPAFREQCMQLFESNLPKFFAPEERTQFSDWLDHDAGKDYYVVEEQGRIVACGGVFLDDVTGEAGLSWGMVDAAHHGRGIGRQFTMHRIALLKKQYPDAVYKIETSQHTAAFYEKMGFRTLEVIPDGFSKGYDQYNMVLELL